MSQVFILPFPTSANGNYKNVSGGGRAKTANYEAWIKEAGYKLNLQRPKPVEGPVKVVIRAVRPDKKKRDVDNLTKPILDLLVRHKILADDHLVQSVTSEWTSDNLSGVSVYVTPLNQKS